MNTDPSIFTEMLPQILIWWFIVQSIGIVALPLTVYMFRGLPDRGYAFSKSLGLLLVGYGSWLLAMLGLGTFGIPMVLLVIAAVAAAGSALWWFAPPSNDSSSPVLPSFRQALPSIVAYEVLFLAALIMLAWMRSYQPHPWGTERPMDFAFFNAIQRSDTFPPHDPWLAHYSINYYYFGYLFMAIVAMLSGLAPPVAYNLSLALIFALAALGIAGILANAMLLAAPRPSQHLLDRTPVRWFVALFGVLMVLLAGNQTGALQIMVGDYRVVVLDGQQLSSALGQVMTGNRPAQLTTPVQTSDGDFGTFSLLDQGNSRENFNWWWPSRALWDEDSTGLRRYNITEFPYFSFCLGDMHPHVMALPWNLLAMAVALHLLARPAPPISPIQSLPWREVILTALIIGNLYPLNSWDFPTALLLYAGALILRPTPWRQAAIHLGIVLLLMLLLFFPFLVTFRSLVGFAQPLTDLPLLSGLTRIIAPYTASKSGLHNILIMFGAAALPLLLLLVHLVIHDMRHREEEHQQITHLLIVIPVLFFLIGILIGFPLLVLPGLAFVALLHAARPSHTSATRFVLLVIALGCAILFGTELIYIRDVFNSRMNTIFKFSYQVWLLWGTVAPYALWVLLRSRPPTLGFVTLLLTLLFGIGGMVYPFITLSDMATKGTAIGLHGETPRTRTDAGKAAVTWLREHAEPNSVILEAVGGSYSGEGYGAISASTGIPTVLGWPGHERQWRGGDPRAMAEIAPREADVDTIYRTNDVAQARALLERYGVTYVYIGNLERQRYPDGITKFDMIGRIVFAHDDIVIYRIGD